MILLSLFTTNAGIFCFIPISDRLVESRITSTYLFAPFFYVKEENPCRSPSPVLADYELASARSLAEATPEKGYTWEASPTNVPFYSPGKVSEGDHQFLPACTSICPACGTELVARSDSSVISSGVGPSSGWESTSFTTMSDHDVPTHTYGCDSNETLSQSRFFLNGISSVMAMPAFRLLHGQDQFPGVDDNDSKIVALIKAFSMLRL